MKVVLVHMPWASANVPSLALGLLHSIAEEQGHDVTVRYANLDLIDWLVGETEFGAQDQLFFSELSYFLGAGDYAFASALYDDTSHSERFTSMLLNVGASSAEADLTRRVRELTPRFIDRLADDLASMKPDVVGFTTSFQQNTASLAAARALKARRPETVTMMGGANCDGEQGAALHRNFSFVDFVVRGEGEQVFPDLLTRLTAGHEDFADVTGVCWRDTTGKSVANPMAAAPLPPGMLTVPNYDGYFERLADSVAADWEPPRLVVEGARGCWWGEKHHCTFCGLNGSFMQFRSKPPETFLGEVLRLARRYQVLDFAVVDNIIDMGYFDTVLAGIAESGYDLRLIFEVKSNIRRRHFQALRDAGAVHVQPGIENLNSHVLHLMDKGVTGSQNVRALRDAQSTGVTTDWNYLYGFPGEHDSDYTTVLDQMSTLHHLQPPNTSTRIVIERFSPYFNKPEMGFPVLRPPAHYREIYRLSDGELMDLAYLFEAEPQGIDETLAEQLRQAIAVWSAEHRRSRLTFHDLGDRIILLNKRPAFTWTVMELDAPAELALFRKLDQPHSPTALAGNADTGELAEVEELLAQWMELGLVFHDGTRYVHVATAPENQALMRLRPGVVGAASSAPESTPDGESPEQAQHGGEEQHAVATTTG